MLPIRVALVPDGGRDVCQPAELTRVAAVLQTQVARDLAPVWNVQALVSAFTRLEDVPPGYLPVVVTSKRLPIQWHGLHYTAGGLPFALVLYCEEWSLAASHELLEMVCDPLGVRTQFAPSLADKQQQALGKARSHRQGEVEYLVEVCDPCEHSTYEIDGITVSDFVTPNFYDATARGGVQYSFTGRIDRPLQLLVGGEISWRTADGTVYQAEAGSDDGSQDDEDLGAAGEKPADLRTITIRELPGAPRQLSREWSNSKTAKAGPKRTSPPADGYYPTPASSKRYGAGIRHDVRAFVKWAQEAVRQPPTIDEVVELLRKLVEDDSFWSDYSNKNDATFRLTELNRIGVTPADPKLKPPDRAQFERILDSVEEQQRLAGLFGQDMFAPGLASWLCMLIS